MNSKLKFLTINLFKIKNKYRKIDLEKSDFMIVLFLINNG